MVFGHKGWIGRQVVTLLEQWTPSVELRLSDTRVCSTNFAALLNEMAEFAPTHVFCLLGRTHGVLDDGTPVPSIDYLEHPGKLVENVGDNLTAPLLLARACNQLDSKLCYLGTGCIFDGPGPFGDDDDPNFTGSSYSTVKGTTDVLMRRLFNDCVLNVRIRMPITGEAHPRDFITKIVGYEKVCSAPNSVSVLDELLPLMVRATLDGRTGTINLVNPGTIDHNTILGMYRDTCAPGFTWANFSYDEQLKVIKSHRSNNQLSTSKLQSWFPEVTNASDAIQRVLDGRAAK